MLSGVARTISCPAVMLEAEGVVELVAVTVKSYVASSIPAQSGGTAMFSVPVVTLDTDPPEIVMVIVRGPGVVVHARIGVSTMFAVPVAFAPTESGEGKVTRTSDGALTDTVKVSVEEPVLRNGTDIVTGVPGTADTGEGGEQIRMPGPGPSSHAVIVAAAGDTHHTPRLLFEASL